MNDQKDYTITLEDIKKVVVQQRQSLIENTEKVFLGYDKKIEEEIEKQ